MVIRVVAGAATLNIIDRFGANLMEVREGDVLRVTSNVRISHDFHFERSSTT